MTIYEHAMVGINGGLALGLGRRYGWQIVAWAGVAAVLPDLDGLTILFGPQCYAEGHRLWGHNLLVAGVAAAVFSAAAYYSDVLTRLQKRLAKRPWGSAAQRCDRGCAANSGSPVQVPAECAATRLALWIVVGIAAAYSHLLMDVLFSAGRDLPIWGVPLFWPFSGKVYAYPLVRWGDVGATLIFAASMFAMLHWPTRLRTIAAASLTAVAVYMAFRGLTG